MQITNAVVIGDINLHLKPLPAIMVMASALIVFGIAVWSGFCVFAKLGTGWKALTRRFPATDVHKLGKKYAGQDGYFKRKSWNSPFCLFRLFLVELAQEGLLVTAYFARRSPILIPWSDIQKVEDEDTGMFGSSTVEITVDYERERHMTFSIPREALTVIQENVPAERLHKAASFSQLIKNRLNNPPN
jgi:hypothetical protein